MQTRILILVHPHGYFKNNNTLLNYFSLFLSMYEYNIEITTVQLTSKQGIFVTSVQTCKKDNIYSKE